MAKQTVDMEEILNDLQNEFGAISADEEYLSTGSVILDSVISNGNGFPRGKFIQFTSESGLGKSTTALHMCKVLCAAGYKTVYLDAEKSLNGALIKGVGLTPYEGKSFIHINVNTFEGVEKILDKVLVEDDSLALIVVDSITALLPAKLLEASVGSVLPGIKARVAGLFFEKYKAKMDVSKSKASILFLNQTRMKLNFTGISSNAEAGSQAQAFYMDIRLFFKKLSSLKRIERTVEGDTEVPYGSEIKVYSTKNRYNRPNVVGVATVIFGKGVSNLAAYTRWLIQNKYIKTSAYPKISIPELGIEQSVRGMKGLNAWIKNNISVIKNFVDSHGGFRLIETEEDLQDDSNQEQNGDTQQEVSSNPNPNLSTEEDGEE